MIYRAHVPSNLDKKRKLPKVLRQFWQRVGPRETHLTLLREFAAIDIRALYGRNGYKRRRKKSAAALIQAQNYECFVCAGSAIVGHHIVQLQFGGTNEAFNIVPVCHACHADIHPWMPTDETPDARPIWG